MGLPELRSRSCLAQVFPESPGESAFAFPGLEDPLPWDAVCQASALFCGFTTPDIIQDGLVSCSRCSQGT